MVDTITRVCWPTRCVWLRRSGTLSELQAKNAVERIDSAFKMLEYYLWSSEEQNLPIVFQEDMVDGKPRRYPPLLWRSDMGCEVVHEMLKMPKALRDMCVPENGELSEHNHSLAYVT